MDFNSSNSTIVLIVLLAKKNRSVDFFPQGNGLALQNTGMSIDSEPWKYWWSTDRVSSFHLSVFPQSFIQNPQENPQGYSTWFNWLRPCAYVVLGAKMKAPWCPEVGIRAVHGPYFAARRRESMPRCHWQPLALLNWELSITSVL